jgi:hypothetical protein
VTRTRSASRRTVGTFGVAVVVGVALAGGAEAQYLGGGTKTAAEAQIADLEQLRDKFLALGKAFSEDLFDWRPMEDVRSLRDVMALIAGEGALFPTMWNYPAPDWVAQGGFEGERQRLVALSQGELLAQVERSFGHVLGIVRELSDADRAQQVNFFGLNVDLGTAVQLMANDMHEHLGQSIAYARMHRIVPPWSQ